MRQKNDRKERESLSVDEPEGSREGWKIKDLAEEASQTDVDEIQRQILRGNETKGSADDRDLAGSADSDETSHGREEAKNKVKDKANL